MKLFCFVYHFTTIVWLFKMIAHYFVIHFFFFFCFIHIFLWQTLTALGKSWHPEHFTCLVCEKPISAVTFNERDGSPVCSECYAKKYSETCNQCHKPIVGVSWNFIECWKLKMRSLLYLSMSSSSLAHRV